MAGDDLLRRGLDSARKQALARRTDPVAKDRAYMKGRAAEFVEAVDRCLELMREHGNPGLKRFTVRTYRGNTFMEYGRESGTLAWRLGGGARLEPERILAPTGEFADVFGVGWITASALIPLAVEWDRLHHLVAWHKLNKRRTVDFNWDPSSKRG